MNAPLFAVRYFYRISICAAFLLGGRVVAQEITNVDAAYLYLISKHSTWPDSHTQKDLESFAMFKKHPIEAKALLVDKFLAGALTEPQMGKLMAPFSRQEHREVYHEILKHFQPGDITTPFVGFLTYFGEEQDMVWLKTLIVSHPDREGIAGTAVLMVEGKNPHAHAALIELKDVPGKWQERREVKEFFAKNTPVRSDAQSVTHTPQTATASLAVAVPAAVGSTQSSAPRANPDSTGKKWWVMLAGGVVLITALLILRRKPHS